MKHTKGKLATHGTIVFIHTGQSCVNKEIKIANLAFGNNISDSKEDEANAERFVKCWNEHDQLQAKADLCDEMEEALEKVISIRNSDHKYKSMGKCTEMCNVAAIALAKAEKLKG